MTIFLRLGLVARDTKLVKQMWQLWTHSVQQATLACSVGLERSHFGAH